MAENTKCDYKALYFNYENQRDALFECPETKIQGENKCPFHSEKQIYTAEEFQQLINEKILRGMRNNEPVFFIGYNFSFAFTFSKVKSNDRYLPSTDPKDHVPHVSVPIYFSYAKFSLYFQVLNFHFKAVYFDDAIFDGEVSIAASLLEKCTFKNAKFNNRTDFTMTRMVDADFTTSNFASLVRFTDSIFHKCTFLASRFEAPANFATVWFYGKTDLSNLRFKDDVTFSGSKFLDLTYFYYSIFNERINFAEAVFKKRTYFDNVIFADGEKAIFNASNLSMLSFKNTDITRVNFGDVQWRCGTKYKIIDEEELDWSFKPVIDWLYMRTHDIDPDDNFIKFLELKGIMENEKLILRNEEENIAIFRKELNGETRIGSIFLSDDGNTAHLNIDSFSLNFALKDKKEKIYYPSKVNLQSVLSIYRNLRENYEFRLRYDEAGRFFLREMEIKRKYSESFGNNITNYYEGYITKTKNGISRLLSLTGIYYNISRYGESVALPTIIGVIIIFFSTLLFITQLNPLDEYLIEKHIGFSQVSNSTHWYKSFERSLLDFIPLPLLNPDSNFHLSAIDYIIKLVGAVFTFGLIAIALKRRFERKIRH